MMKWPEIKYIESEDGMLEPVLNWPKQPEGNIGKYGSMRLDYLKKHRRILYSQMVLGGNSETAPDGCERTGARNARPDHRADEGG